MTPTQRKAMELVLEKLKAIASGEDYGKLTPVIDAVGAALAEQPAEQVPVAWRLLDEDPYGGDDRWVYYDSSDFRPGTNPEEHFNLEPLYTAPQPRKRLTREEIMDAVCDADLDWHQGWTLDEDAPNRYETLCRAIEAAVYGGRRCMGPRRRAGANVPTGDGEMTDKQPEALRLADALRALHESVKKANAQAEHFEREWYLRGDQLEADEALLRQALEALEFEAGGWEYPPPKTTAAITALRERLRENT